MPRTRTSAHPERPTGGSRLRVLLIGINYAPESSGIAPYSAALAKGLQGRGHDVRVLTTKPHYPEWRVPEAYAGGTRHETIDGVAVTRVRHYVPSKPAGVRRLLSELSFGLRVLTARWHRPDVVLFVSPALFATAMGVWRVRHSLRRVPTAVWTQDLYSLGIVETGSHGAGSTVERVITATERYVARSTDAAVVIHDRFADSAVRLGADRDRTRVIRNWSHLELDDERDPSAVRQLLGWREDEIVALHTGNIGVKQDLGNIVEAARVATERGVDVRFVVMGEGSQRELLEAHAGTVGSDRIEFVDPVPQGLYLDALRAADVLVVNEATGLREMAVPSKLTSYFTAGRPVVAATDASSITASEVRAAGAGLRVDPATPDALLDAVLRLASDPARAAELGVSAQAYRQGVLSEDAAIDAFEAFLTELRDMRHDQHGSTSRWNGRSRRGDHDRLVRASL
jgi:glycosyltransferase involved in cell wall biosynthesis